MLKPAASDIAVEAQREVNEKVFIPSRYEFLKAHKGLRPKSLMGLISNTGSGKTSLLKCIIAEAAACVPVLVWLSEETILEYQALITDIDKSILKYVTFVEEKPLAPEFKQDQETFLTHFESLVVESKCRLVFIDNITTSLFYNSRFGFFGQNKTADFLIDFVKRVCTVFYVAHTSKEVTDNYNKIITPEDIRGSKELPLLTEYFYTIQKFTSNGNIYNILRNAKHRHHEKAAGFFSLAFERGYYVGDAKIPFEMINFIFKSRDYLGRKTAKVKKDEPPKELPPVKDESKQGSLL